MKCSPNITYNIGKTQNIPNIETYNNNSLKIRNIYGRSSDDYGVVSFSVVQQRVVSLHLSAVILY